ncbi:MAG TPA: hypothetical protein VME86_11420 [Acidobacteriaceae bacterium]|nr:hypothetical protein [Acidobacteriaceae bacterium]HUB00585.1 hypothetical protein [Terracidiphilus sp.]
MRKALAVAVVSLPLALAGCSHSQPVAYEPPPPPPAYTEIAQRAYHQGVAAARRDIAAGLPPDVARHPHFRNPPVPPPAFEDFRHGFRAGYQAVYRHGPPPGY